MFKKILLSTICLSVIGALVFGAIWFTLAQASRASRPPGVNAAEAGWRYYPLTATGGELSADEKEALAYMREEEKLAHDLYVVWYAKWGAGLFRHISMCEQMHTWAVKNLLDRYGLADPASSSLGVFTNPELQSLYDQVLERGNQSLEQALKAGGAVEEIDILDLQKRLAVTNHADIQQVFNHLMMGSYRHLQAYSTNWSALAGKSYQPQYMNLETFQGIAGSGMGGRGGGCRGGM